LQAQKSASGRPRRTAAAGVANVTRLLAEVSMALPWLDSPYAWISPLLTYAGCPQHEQLARPLLFSAEWQDKSCKSTTLAEAAECLRASIVDFWCSIAWVHLKSAIT
jgi:hypothetical protein